eukprot:5463233-Alexandrium_andersonii.AAC.1
MAHRRYELRPTPGYIRKVSGKGDMFESPVWKNPYRLQNVPWDSHGFARAVDGPYVTERRDH